MRTTTTLRLRTDARLEAQPDRNEASLILGPRRVRLQAPHPGILAALDLLASGPTTEADLATAAIGGGDRQALRTWSRLIVALRSGNWLEQAVADPDGDLVTLRPTSTLPNASGSWLGDETVLIISRFALLRRGEDEMLIESPRAGAVMVVHDPRVALLFTALHTPTRLIDLVKLAADNFDASEVRTVVRLLVEGRFALVAGQAEDDPPASAPADRSDRLWLDQWNVADLLFHSRSRMGRHINPYGGTYRFTGRYAPLPAARPAQPGAPVIPLARPDLAAVAERDPALTTVIEERASVRRHDDEHPITAEQLGELLYRVQRLRWAFVSCDHGEVASRPYPGGGGLYELEVYPVVNHVAGLDSGLYHYDSKGHRLELITEAGDATNELLELARMTSLMSSRPQVLLTVTARFGRVMWKYESVGYAVILKNVGALYQTLYLVATAMGLAPCALGGGDSEAFGQAAGLRFEEEASVGEFVLGSRPADWTAPTGDPEAVPAA